MDAEPAGELTLKGLHRADACFQYQSIQEKWIPVFRPKMRSLKKEHFQEKWIPVFRPKMRPLKKNSSTFQFHLIGKRPASTLAAGMAAGVMI